MSCFFKFSKDTTIHIPRTNEINGVIYYEINVKVKDVEWFVSHRYRDFDELHEKLVNEQSVSRKLLPPKKVIGNRNPAFIEQRRLDLEGYMQNLLGLFRITMPRVFIEFLDFNKYDIIYLLHDLAQYFCSFGDSILCTKKEYTFSVLELYAITERIRLPYPPCETKDTYDFSHVLDFCVKIERVNIICVKMCSTLSKDFDTTELRIGRSNLLPSKLCFDLNAFRNIKVLKISGILTENIIDVSNIKESLQQLHVHNTIIKSINQILLCDNIHKSTELIDSTNHHDHVDNHQNSSTITTSAAPTILTPSTLNWNKIELINLTGNSIQNIDSSIVLVPNVKTLILDRNYIRNISNLNHLSKLNLLSLSENLICDLIDWHKELGNLITLNLSQNQLKSLKGLRKLYSLINLDLSCNLIDDLNEIDYIAGLPLLENLRLTGNPLAGSVDYRPRVLSRFNDRASHIYLDNEKGSQKEIDTALVLSALNQSKAIKNIS